MKEGIASPRPVRISALQEEMVGNYPVWSIRELLLNAIIHRDYQIGNAPVKFYDYHGMRLEISNPGGLYGQAKPDNFPYVNDYRNPLLAEAMKVMGYVNKFNRGIAKVKAELKENGNPPPIFDVNKQTEFRGTLRPSRFFEGRPYRAGNGYPARWRDKWRDKAACPPKWRNKWRDKWRNKCSGWRNKWRDKNGYPAKRRPKRRNENCPCH